MPSFAKIFRNKDASKKTTAPIANGNTSSKPQWTDSWLRTRVDPEEVAELLRGCTRELKTRGQSIENATLYLKLTIAALDVPFLILPFRPSSDPSAARTFVRNYFLPTDGRPKLKGEKLIAELKMTEVMVREVSSTSSFLTYAIFRCSSVSSNGVGLDFQAVSSHGRRMTCSRLERRVSRTTRTGEYSNINKTLISREMLSALFCQLVSNPRRAYKLSMISLICLPH